MVKAAMVPSSTAPAPAAEEEPAFPRGGRQPLSALERKRLRDEGRAEAEKDFLSSGARKKKRREPALEGKEEDLAFAREAAQGRLPKFVELLKFKGLNVGARIWGAVSSITSKELMISLPDGLRGYVPVREASDTLAELLEKAGKEAAKPAARGKAGSAAAVPALQALFQVGQLVRATIIGLEEGPSGPKGSPKKRVLLSLRVARQNAGYSADSLVEGLSLPACVRSAEDHGYTLTLGIKGVTGFLSKAAHGEGSGGGLALLPGSLVEAVVTQALDRRMIAVTTDSTAVSASLTKEWDGLNIGSLLPGALVNVRVRSVLSDGLIVSFLTYFTGTVDPFHVSLADASVQSSYTEGQKLRARVLYVDPVSKKVCLSLLPHLLKMSSPSSLPAAGSVLQDAIVRRVDPSLGVLLDLPGHGCGYAHISAVADERVDKLDKAMRPGQREAARVIGLRLMDGLAVLSLKPSAVEQYLEGGVSPGQVVKGQVVLVDDKGVLVSLAKNLNAFVPNEHLSDLGAKQGKAKHRLGATVTGRILTADPARQRMTMTLKQALVSSKLKPLAAWEDAEVGMRALGTVVGLADYGVFVRFYGDMKGLVHISELGLEPGTQPAAAFKIGQIVKVHVLGIDPALRRMQLSLASQKARAAAAAAQAGGPQPGEVADGIVAGIEASEDGAPAAYRVDLRRGQEVVGTGRLEAAHVADHPAAVEALQDSIQVGSALGNILVLERAQKRAPLRLTRKASLVAAAGTLPQTIEDIAEPAVVPGFVANVLQDAVFVRFLNGLTGRAARPHFADTFVSDARQVFSVGQSVHAQVLKVDSDRGAFSVSLKQSLTGDRSSAFACSLFRGLEDAGAIKAAAEAAAGEPPVDWSAFAIGSGVKGTVHELKDYGTICDLDLDPNLVGLVAPHQAGGSPEVGTAISARILDVNKKDGIVDLSLKPDLVQAAQSVRKRSKNNAAEGATLPAVGETVAAKVQLVREGEEYAIVSLPEHGQALGCVGVQDFNVRDLSVSRQLSLGSSHRLLVAAHPSPDTGGRLILQMLPGGQPAKKEPKARLQKLKGGTVVTGVVMQVHPLHLVVQLPEGHRGRVHVTESVDEGESSSVTVNPISGYTVGQEVKAVVLGVWHERGRKGHQRNSAVELTMRPTAVAAAEENHRRKDLRLTASNVSTTATYTGYVSEVHPDYLMVSIGPCLTGRVHVLDAAADPAALVGFPDRFHVGQPVRCRVLQLSEEESKTDLTLVVDSQGKRLRHTNDAPSAGPGSLLMGRVDKLRGALIRIQIAPRMYGSVSMMDLHDGWVKNAVHGLKEGTFVRCCVLDNPLTQMPALSPEEGTGKKRKRQEEGGRAQPTGNDKLIITLSLKPSEGGCWPGQSDAAVVDGAKPCANPDSVKVGDQVSGYVASHSSSSVFVILAKGLTARVALKNLANEAVEDPQAAFPLGKLVTGCISKAETDRLEMSLKGDGDRAAKLKQLQPGQTVRGIVARVVDFGVFVRLQHLDITGLAHKSELSDSATRDAAAALKVGQGVRAKVLEVDSERGRFSLGLKDSYFVGEGEVEEEEGITMAPGQDMGQPDLDDKLLDVLEADSDDDGDWRNAAAVGSDEENAEGSDDEGKEAAAALTQGRAPAAADLDEALLGGQPAGSRKRRALNAQTASDNGADRATGDARNEAADPEAESEEESEAESGEDAEDSGLDEGASGAPHGANGGTGILLSGSVGWGADDQDEALTEPAGGEEPAREPNKRQLKRQKREQEEAVRAAEMARLEGKAPEAATHYERELLGAPNSSLLWIRYMAFLIGLGELPQARAVAERALQTIHFREEQEKLNVWVAWLNLEMNYGDPPEDVALKLFQRALTYNDQKKLYMAFVGILERAGQEELLLQTFKAMTRKFPQSAKVWLRQLAYLQLRDDAEGARKLLDRATSSTPARKHIKILRSAALQEFRFSSPERGRSIFESILRNYPKRTDLWSVYIDQEVKQGEQARIRSLFERAVTLQLPAKKIKFLFKRYLEYEKQDGTPATVEKVKQAAREYVEQHLA